MKDSGSISDEKQKGGIRGKEGEFKPLSLSGMDRRETIFRSDNNATSSPASLSDIQSTFNTKGKRIHAIKYDIAIRQDIRRRRRGWDLLTWASHGVRSLSLSSD